MSGGAVVRRAGFVLAGGASTRMGRDKALLPLGGRTLVEHVAASVAEAAGSAVIVGHSERHGGLGFQCVRDVIPGRGPLGGIATALGCSDASWNLIVACDMPGVTAPFLGSLLEAAEASGGDCLVPVWNSTLIEPLCAAYHRRCLPVFREALAREDFAVRAAIAAVHAIYWPVEDAAVFENINTPDDLRHHESLPRRKVRTAER